MWTIRLRSFGRVPLYVCDIPPFLRVMKYRVGESKFAIGGKRQEFFAIIVTNITSIRFQHFTFVFTAPFQAAVTPVAQVVNLEFYLCLRPGFEPRVCRTFDLI